MTSSIAPTPIFSASYSIATTEEAEIARASEQSEHKRMSVEAMQALWTAIGSAAATLLTIGTETTSKALADANYTKWADWTHQGAAFWLGLSVTLGGAAAYFCILDQLAKRSNKANPQNTSLNQSIAVVNQNFAYSSYNDNLA